MEKLLFWNNSVEIALLIIMVNTIVTCLIPGFFFLSDVCKDYYKSKNFNNEFINLLNGFAIILSVSSIVFGYLIGTIIFFIIICNQIFIILTKGIYN
jgi:hypothetical protein